MNEKNNEYDTYITLAHPDPFKDPIGFLESLPDEFIDYVDLRDSKSAEEKRSILILTLQYDKNILSVLLTLLKDYYALHQ